MNKRGFINYFYNSNLGVGVGSECQDTTNPCIKNESMLIAPAVTVMMGDGARYISGMTANCYSSTLANCPKRNPTSGATPPPGSGWADSLPNAWPSQAEKDAMSSRHLGGSIFAFADGHVKWLRTDKLTYDNPTVGTPTFNAVGVS
jgi:prepilin-type processing-associated H-X9-DG protein